MKIITRLSSETVSDIPTNLPSQLISAAMDEPKPGFLRAVQLTGAGVFVRHGGHAAVLIPMEEILRLAEAAEPNLRPA
jgi:hypothetical protein